MGMERRWGMRKPVAVDVVIDNQPACLLRGRIGNISIGGLFVQTESTPLRMNASVELVLMLEEGGNTRVYRLPAIVVRLTSNGAGLMFDQYDVNAFRTLVVLLLEQQQRLLGQNALRSLQPPARQNVSSEGSECFATSIMGGAPGSVGHSTAPSASVLQQSSLD